MSLEGGREVWGGREGREGGREGERKEEGEGGEGGRGGEGREGWRGGREGRERWEGEGGRGGMTVINIPISPQYLNNNHVTYYVITYVGIRLCLRRTMVLNYYVCRGVDIGHPDKITN